MSAHVDKHLMSEQIYSPFADTPTTNGLLRLTKYKLSSYVVCTTMAKEPCKAFATLSSVDIMSPSYMRSNKCATASLSVSELNATSPPSVNSFLSCCQLSITPLCTMAKLPP